MTIRVDVLGKIKQAEQIEYMCFDALRYLMPRIERHIEVEVHFVNKCDNNVAGDCYGDHEEVFINIAKNSYDYTYPFNERILTLCHELVHAKQFIKGELSGSGTVWKGVDMSLIRDIKNQPWEQEAFKLEVELYNKYITLFRG